MSNELVRIGQWTKEQREKVMIMYVSTEKTLKELAVDTGIPISTLKEWSRKYKWKTYKTNSLDKFEALLVVTSDRVASFEELGHEVKKLWYEAEDIKEKEQVVNMILKVDKRVAEWMGIAGGIE